MNGKKLVLSVMIMILIILCLYVFFYYESTAPGPVSIESKQEIIEITKRNDSDDVAGSIKLSSPISRATERVTKKPFGILIDSRTSPIQPERFSGYHTGTDFEIFPEELETEVLIEAVCDGKIELKRFSSGYGGVVVESCVLENQPITVVYGHLKISSISHQVGDEIKSGELVGVLGASESEETDGERKHLHLGFRRGTQIDLTGYVSVADNLKNWIDPCLYVCR